MDLAPVSQPRNTFSLWVAGLLHSPNGMRPKSYLRPSSVQGGRESLISSDIYKSFICKNICSPPAPTALINHCWCVCVEGVGWGSPLVRVAADRARLFWLNGAWFIFFFLSAWLLMWENNGSSGGRFFSSTFFSLLPLTLPSFCIHLCKRQKVWHQ